MEAKTKPKQRGEIVGYDITIPEGETTSDELGGKLNKWCKNWAFQLELGESGYRHWQVRCKLYKPRRKNKAQKDSGIPGIWSMTSGDTHSHKSFTYVLKEEGRIQGPFDNRTWIPPQKVTRQLKKFRGYTPHPWQEELKKRLQRVDDRSIVYITNATGNQGKTILIEDLCQKRLAKRIPPLQNAKDIMQMVFCYPEIPIYLVDMPRAMQGRRLTEFYEAIETIKGGWCYDTRYKGVDRWFDRPQICIFANTPPEYGDLSRDMWEVYNIVDNQLVNVTRAELSKAEEPYAFVFGAAK